MSEVRSIEIEALPHDLPKEKRAKHSSYDPQPYIPCVRNETGTNVALRPEGGEGGSISEQSKDPALPRCSDLCRYLPCRKELYEQSDRLDR
jgi:hypothetical protein